jgi:hypothetical protein
MMRERKRKHDDVHFPLQGRGKRATPPKQPYVPPRAELVPYNPGQEREPPMNDRPTKEG